MTSPRVFAGALAGRRPADIVRSATGADQEWFAHVASVANALDIECELIERCSDGHLTADEIVDLPVGARTSLLWQIRRATFGDALDAVLECTSCHEKLDIALSVDDVLDHSDRGAESSPFTRQLDGHTARFRLPTGRDQRLAATAANAERALCRRCLVDVDGTSADALDDEFVDRLIDPLSDAIADVDPGADAELLAVCPSCDADVTAELDAFSYLRDELLGGAERLLDDVHVLATRYHWSERAILALPVERRRAYLDLIADAELP